MPDVADNSLQGELEEHDLFDLQLYHANPRIGNVQIIKESIRENSHYKPILVNKGTLTGREMEVLSGNHQLKALRELQAEFPNDPNYFSVKCYVIDVDSERASKIVLTDNRSAEVGTFDDLILLEELGKLSDTTGTGYDPADLMALQDLTKGAPTLDELEEEAGGEPLEDDDYNVFKIKVHPDDMDFFRKVFGSFPESYFAVHYLLSLIPEEARESLGKDFVDTLDDDFFSRSEDSA